MFSAYAKHKNKFYIYGGTNYSGNGYSIGMDEDDAGSSGQFFALDLSKPWTSMSPSWTQLPSGPRCTIARGAISLDGIKFLGLTFDNEKSSVFSFETKIWNPSKAVFSKSNADPVTLGTEGTVLIPGERISQNTTIGVYDVYSFDSDNASKTLLPPPSTVFNSTFFTTTRIYLRGVWSQYLKSAVYYGDGGNSLSGNPTIRSSHIFTYHPESRTWEEKAIKLSLHGHQSIRNSDILILDLVTLEWKQGGTESGTDKPVDFGRPSTPVNIFQISTGTWVSEYIPSAEYVDPVPVSPSKSVSPPSPSSEPSHPSMDQSSDAKLDIGIIAGGTVGGVAMVALIGFLVWMRKKRGSRHRHHHDDPPSDTSFTSYQRESMVDKHATSGVIQTPSRVTALHPSRYPYGSDVVDDDATDNRHSANDVNFHATRRATRSPPPNPYSHSSGANVYNSYAADGSRYSDRTLASPHSGVSGVTTYGYELPYYSPSPPSRSRSGSRNPQMLDHSHMMHTRPYATGGRWVDERPGPQWQP
ncbi:hypothetical protein DFQ27_007195 [Actinomortierella ambigua]|uniref:Kelch repeat protein n=1 Tax=Actinomortierella ambigua TaxID=1343610 RepID=A0A9P6PVE2_9FUNG|nr:hypothetical protein DFQ27_007195 [Actinomortierella ambigua]